MTTETYGSGHFGSMTTEEENQETRRSQEARAEFIRQMYAQLAQKAERAAKAAEAAISGKQAIVNQLEQEVGEAQAVVREEAASCQRTNENLRISLAAANQANHLHGTLMKAIRLAQDGMVDSQKTAERTQQELEEKTALLNAAKGRLETLLRQLSSAKMVLSAVKQAASKAEAIAKSVSSNLRRSRRQLQGQSVKEKKEIRDLQSGTALNDRQPVKT